MREWVSANNSVIFGIRCTGLRCSELRFRDVRIDIRLLPLQVMGKKATTTAYKARSALRMLSLESADVRTARLAVRSLLSDMGVESGLWSLPDLDSEDNLENRGRCFPFSIPLADFDHLLHHVMEEVEGGFSTAAKELWDNFDAQVSALAKVFSKRDHVDSWWRTWLGPPSISICRRQVTSWGFGALA